jgi:peptide chain release factor 2
VPAKEQELVKLETAAGQPDFWRDQRKAQDDMKRLSELKKDIKTWRDMEKKVSDLVELLAISDEESDSSLLHEINVETEELQSHLQDL